MQPLSSTYRPTLTALCPLLEKQQRLIGRLENEFVQCARRYNLPLGDFPNLEEFRTNLLQIKDISKFQKLDKSLVKEMDRVRLLGPSAERRLARPLESSFPSQPPPS